jgi:hypothetical protein
MLHACMWAPQTSGRGCSAALDMIDVNPDWDGTLCPCAVVLERSDRSCDGREIHFLGDSGNHAAAYRVRTYAGRPCTDDVLPC